MNNGMKIVKSNYLQTISAWFSFTLSDKLKFSIKASLSIVLAYLIPISQGWTQPQTAAITVIIIAAAGPIGESISKGMYRVIGTVAGAIIGMGLIGIFPQDRDLYLIFLSIFVMIALYLARAYKGDMTVFLISAVTMMMVFQNGEVDGVFIYGIDRTYMTIIGIVIYTFVGIFLWPVRVKDDVIEHASTLLGIQSDLYSKRDGEKEERKILHQKLIEQEQAFSISLRNMNDASGEFSLSEVQKNCMLHDSKKINETLTLLSLHDKEDFADRYTKYIDNYHQGDGEILELFKALFLAWTQSKEITIPEVWEPKYQISHIMELSHIDRAAFASSILDMKKLHKKLRVLAEKLNAMISPLPTKFVLVNTATKSSAFLWFDIEDMKGTLLSFFIFWFATFVWIFVNPPAGFMIVTLATALSVLTTFSPLKPSILIFVFSISFAFATLMYVLVLPNLHYGWELGIFLFIYAFIGFHLLNPKISLFFLIGMATLGLDNTMNYNFNLFLMILFIFYFFLFILLLFYYIPFSTKPEHLFLTMKQRFFKLSQKLLQRSNNLIDHKETFGGRLAAKYSEIHLMSTVKKMQLWVSQIDTKYFDTVDQKVLLGFSIECETFVYLLKMMYRRDLKMKDNVLIKAFREKYSAENLADLLGEYASGKEVEKVAEIWKDEKKIVLMMEERLERFLGDIEFSDHSENEILEFYENISLRRNVWISLLNCQKMMEKIDFKALETNRF